MTIREQIQKRTGHYSRDVKIMIAMMVTGTIGLFLLLESDIHLSLDSGTPIWMFMLCGIVIVLYGVGGLGTFAFSLLLALTAKCPKCNRRFRTLRKDWTFCPFCGINFDHDREK